MASLGARWRCDAEHAGLQGRNYLLRKSAFSRRVGSWYGSEQFMCAALEKGNQTYLREAATAPGSSGAPEGSGVGLLVCDVQGRSIEADEPPILDRGWRPSKARSLRQLCCYKSRSPAPIRQHALSRPRSLQTRIRP